MLLRCGTHVLAIDALAVDSTLLAPTIESSALASSYCKGVIEHAGMRVPAVDLSELLQLSCGQDDPGMQALTVRYDGGVVAFLVNQVVEVTPCDRAAVLHVPAFALPHPGLMRGALPRSALPAGLAATEALASPQFLIIHAPALRAHETLQNLAKASQSSLPPQASALAPLVGESTAVGDQPVTPAQRVITVDLGKEWAIALDEVDEIIAFRPQSHVTSHRSDLLGLLAHRGCSIPVMCLGALLGLVVGQAPAELAVLVVDVQGEKIGFAVPRLRTIETVNWRPRDVSQTPSSSTKTARAMVKVGEGEHARLLSFIALKDLAQALLDESAFA